MDQDTFKAVVALARYAPSAHNTQPARWRLQANGTILISADLSRQLSVGDPQDRDLLIAGGGAVEGTVLALAQLGHGAQVTLVSGPDANGYRPLAVVTPSGNARPEDAALSENIRNRRTHRLGFERSHGPDVVEVDHPCVTTVWDPVEIEWLSGQIDQASARIMQDRAFRAELLDWMRLTPRHPRYHIDGLNVEALALDAFTARLIRPVLGTSLYRLLSACGLGPALSGEAAKSRTSSGILLFHWPKDGELIDAGRFFYRLWLDMTALGFAGWPAAALADDPGVSAQIKERFGLPEHHHLFNTLRLGRTMGATPPNTRLGVDDVINS